MTCLSSFPKNEQKGGSETSSCVRCSNQLCTRGQPPHGRVSAPRGSLFRSGVGIPRVSVVLAPRCSFVTLRAVTMFPALLATSAAGPCRCWRRAFFSFLPPPNNAANKQPPLTRLARCHSGAVMALTVHIYAPASLKYLWSIQNSATLCVCVGRSHTHRFNFETDNNKLACIVRETGPTLVHAKKKHMYVTETDAVL